MSRQESVDHALVSAVHRLVEQGPASANELYAATRQDADGRVIERAQWNDALTTLLRAGWVLRDDRSVCVATAPALDAVGPGSDDGRLAAAASDQAHTWEARRAALLEGSLPVFDPDSAAREILPLTPAQAAVRQASQLFMAALRDGGSVLAPGASIWVPDVLGEIEDRMASEDFGPETFWVKLDRQFDGSSDAVRQCVAELLAWIALPLADLTADRKRIWVASQLVTLPAPPPLPVDLDVAFEGSAYRGGLAFRTQLYKALAAVAAICRAGSELSAADRAALVTDPWAWGELVERNWSGARAAGNSLKFLGHPQTFVAIVSDPDKRVIVEAWRGDSTGIHVDRALYELTLELQQQRRQPVSFYTPPLVDRWRPASEPASVGDPVGQAWLVRGSAVQGQNLVPGWLEEGIVSLPASHLKVIPDPIDQGSLRQLINAGYQHLNAGERKELVDNYLTFLTGMTPGDLVVTVAQDAIHLGELADGDAELVAVSAPTRLRRPVKWLTPPEGVPLDDAPEVVVAKVRTQRDVVDLSDIREPLLGLLPLGDGADEVSQNPALEAELADPDDALAAGLYMDRIWLDDVVELLRSKRQLVLYGPPGTGKTYVALALARYLAPDTHTLVQFHPSTSYEDFFEGLRPVLEESTLQYEMKRGPLRRMVDDARKNPGVPYILVIDEINRANLPKVFGELYFLLEYRDRGIELLYSPGEQFVLPRNVFLIGTMNTADRSIALVDAAMRRRFAFVELHPDREPTRSVLPRWCGDLGNDLPARLLTALNSDIKDRELRLGPSYFMDPKIMAPGVLERIWRTQVLPLLAENEAGLRSSEEVEAEYALEVYLQRLGEGLDSDQEA